MDARYEALAAPMPTLDTLLSLQGSIAQCWETGLLNTHLSEDALNVATWLRRATATQEYGGLRLPFLRHGVRGMG